MFVAMLMRKSHHTYEDLNRRGLESSVVLPVVRYQPVGGIAAKKACSFSVSCRISKVCTGSLMILMVCANLHLLLDAFLTAWQVVPVCAVASV